MNSLENENGEKARNLLYQDFLHNFVWHKDTKTWTKRWKGFSIGHMFFVPPTAGECFYLRTLLCICWGPRSFIDLRTFQTVEYATFQDACQARGLLEDDGEWFLYLTEASQIQSGRSLRQLFTSVLLFCQVSAPENLWLEFCDHICDNLIVAIPNPTIDRICDYGLFLLNCLLGESGYTLEQFPRMPISQENWAHVNCNYLISEQLSYKLDCKLHLFHEHLENIQNIPEQLAIYDRIVHAVLGGVGRTFFLSSPGGTGKTYVYKTMCHWLRLAGKIVLCVASSGITTLLLLGGQTAHSIFHIPINTLNANSTCNISNQDSRAKLLRCVNLIIWDKAPTQSQFTHEALNWTLKDICKNEHRPFGSKTVVLGGNF